MDQAKSTKIIYYMTVSLDGYFEGPGQDIGWSIVTPEMHRFINDQQKSFDMYLHGRKMYDLMAAYWPTADEDPSNPDFVIEFSRIWKEKPKIVFSKTLAEVGWNSRLERGDPAEVVAKLKTLPGKNIVVGGAELASALLPHGLIDEFWVYVNPIILGSGRAMFPLLDQRINLRLLESHRFDTGVVFLRYENVSSD